MNAFKMCFNPKVLAVLGLVALGLFALAPNMALAALPILVALACPLSMAAMGLFMGRRHGEPGAQLAGAGQFTCPMHPQVASTTPGRCPACGMNLVPTAAPEPTAIPQPVPSVGQNREVRLAELQAQMQQVRAQQAAIARELERLEPREPEAPEPRVIQEAEQVARKAEPGP